MHLKNTLNDIKIPQMVHLSFQKARLYFQKLSQSIISNKGKPQKN